jgi:hypothetical protein
MLEAFRVRGRLDAKGRGVGEAAALGDEHPRQAAAKVQGWSGRVPEEFGGRGFGFKISRRVVFGWSVKAGYAEN